jgi:hypothetical protein
MNYLSISVVEYSQLEEFVDAHGRFTSLGANEINTALKELNSNVTVEEGRPPANYQIAELSKAIDLINYNYAYFPSSLVCDLLCITESMYCSCALKIREDKMTASTRTSVLSSSVESKSSQPSCNGDCEPCKFAFNKQNPCRNGEDCTRCHKVHPVPKWKRNLRRFRIPN